MKHTIATSEKIKFIILQDQTTKSVVKKNYIILTERRKRKEKKKYDWKCHNYNAFISLFIMKVISFIRIPKIDNNNFCKHLYNVTFGPWSKDRTNT